MRRHMDNPREILAVMKKAKEAKRCAENEKVTLYGMKVLFFYSLWKSEGFKKKRLEKFDEEYKVYAEKYGDDISELNDRLWEKGQFAFELNEHTGKNFGLTGSRLINKQLDLMAYHNNLIGFESAKYMCIAYNVLMDNGYGKTRLERVAQYMDMVLNEVKEVDLYAIELYVGTKYQVVRPSNREAGYDD